jgi:hypothetical protein
MLKTKTIRVKINKRYKDLLINDGIESTLSEIMNIDVKYLSDCSTVLVTAICDFCYKEKELKYQTYLGNIKSHNLFACSHKCSIFKYEKTCMEKFGYDNASKSPEIIEKIEKTFIDKYGFKSPLLSEKSIEKAKKTNIEKYGFEYASQSEEVKNKIKQTNIERYGDTNPMKNDLIKTDFFKRIFDKYGVRSTLRSPEAIKKTLETNREKYGADNYQSSDICKKISAEKYKISISNRIGNDYSFIEWVNCPISVRLNHLVCEKEFDIDCALMNERLRNGKVICLECNKLRSFSGGQSEIFDWIKRDIQIDNVLFNDREFLNGIEIDIVLPDLNIGIEYNGLYWHCDDYKSKRYHLEKKRFCSDIGIDLIQIWEDDWILKKNIVKSIILNRVGKSSKIFARKCNVFDIGNNESFEFLENNHIQGGIKCKYNICLKLSDEIVSVMCFNTRYINGKKNLELVRFCNKINTSVVGGYSRLFKYFLKFYKPDIVVSYSDNSYYSGDMYRKMGFEFDGESINYYWSIGQKKYHRFNFNKKKLIKDGYNKNLTEYEIMKSRKYNLIWGAGNKKWIYKNEQR